MVNGRHGVWLIDSKTLAGPLTALHRRLGEGELLSLQVYARGEVRNLALRVSDELVQPCQRRLVVV
jgi:hypothetical protein